MLFFYRMPSLTRLTVALNWTVREKRKRRRLVKRTKPKSLPLPRMRRRRKKINVTVIFVCTEFHPASTFPLIHEFILTEDVLSH